MQCTRFLASFPGLPTVQARSDSDSMGDTIGMQGTYSVPLFLQKEKAFTDFTHTHACELGSEAEFVRAMA